jgi:hypothetical protein
LFDPDSDTADFRDREEGPEPVDETEDTIRDPAAHRPGVVDQDQQTSEAIAEEGATAPDGAADDHPIDDNSGNDPADHHGADHEPVARDSFGAHGDDEAARFSDSPDDATTVSTPPAADDAVDGQADPLSMTEGDRGANDMDRQSAQSVQQASAGADGASADLPADGRPDSEETTDQTVTGPLMSGADVDQLMVRWREVQLQFVDDPRRSVNDAAQLVSLAANQVTSLLRDQVGALDQNRSSVDADGDEPDTERLRNLMRRYHALLDRMLAV